MHHLTHHSLTGSMLRDVVLKPSGEDENRHNHYPHPDAARHAGVLLARKVSERQLFLQVCVLIV